MAKIDISASQLSAAFKARNITYAGGEFDSEHLRYAINPTGEFTSVEQINKLVVARSKSGLPVTLADLPVIIERRYQEPFSSLTSITTARAVAY